MYIQNIGEKYHNKYYCQKWEDRRTKIYDIPTTCQVLCKHDFICSSQLTCDVSYYYHLSEEEPGSSPLKKK